MTRRYAWGTEVRVEKSRAELMALLAKHGVTDLATTTSATRGDGFEFVLNDRHFRVLIPRPSPDEVRAMGDYDGLYWRTGQKWDEAIAREHRRRWRAHLMLTKMKLEFVASGESTIEREFMANAVLSDGRTVEQAMADGPRLLLVGAVR